MKKLIIPIILIFMALPLRSQQEERTYRLMVLDITTNELTLVKTFPYQVEAPNWTPDGRWLVYNSAGKLYRISPDGKEGPFEISTGNITRCNNDHVISLDGKEIALSSGTAEDWRSRIYIVPFEGGEPRLVTPLGPSYLHGWTPDKKTLAYCAERDGEYDIYTVPAGGGTETRLTHAPGLDDGPEYTPCGKYIWFNSVRTGLMQLWRMHADGSSQEQMTFHTKINSWFPHVSPDGENVVYIAYYAGDLEPGEHLPDKNVELRLMSAAGGPSRLLLKLFGGQGTINVNSWAPDSRRIAFVCVGHIVLSADF
ncbi:MAG: transporter [Bacteroidales bacterium]